MVDESSYDIGHRPYLPDNKRGFWASPNDFIYAGLSLAFRLDVYTVTWFFMMETSFYVFLPTYILSLLLYIIPFIALQSFLGQFSSSGFISAFRLSPLYKGIGYVTLALNICVVSYYSIFAVVPLFFMFASMQNPLPWTCEGFKKWAKKLPNEKDEDLCISYVQNETVSSNEKFFEMINHQTPSVAYFKSLFNDVNLFDDKDINFGMSWQLVLSAILVWTTVAVIFLTLFNTERFSHIVRYAVWTICGLLVVCLIRFSFLPGSKRVYRQAIEINAIDRLGFLFLIPFYGLSDFGPGWGLFVTLSSFNKFDTNIMKKSRIIAFGQMLIFVSFGLLTKLIRKSVDEVTNTYSWTLERTWVIYLWPASAISHIGWANFWSVLFYFMLFLATTLLTIIQLYTILTSLFDEFVSLRECRNKVCWCLIAFTAAISLFFTSSYGIRYVTVLAADTFIAQMILNLFLIFIVLWVYKRERFQKDIQFMINETFSTWKVFTLRYMAPLGTLGSLLYCIFISNIKHETTKGLVDAFAIIFLVIPWIAVPGYAVYYLGQHMGPLRERFQRCCGPHDWYPVQPDDRQRYVEAMENMEATHQLNSNML